MLKATGVVELPFHVRWSDPSITYDLQQRADRIRVYEQVLREGTEDDVRLYIDLDELVDLFDELVLPSTVRRAWADWLRAAPRVGTHLAPQRARLPHSERIRSPTLNPTPGHVVVKSGPVNGIQATRSPRWDSNP